MVGCRWCLICLASAYRLVGDSYIYDGTNQTSTSTLQTILPGILQDSLVLDETLPAYWTVLFTKSDYDEETDDSVRDSSGSIYEVARRVQQQQEVAASKGEGGGGGKKPAPVPLAGILYDHPIFEHGKHTHIRFVEIPDVNGDYAQTKYMYGLAVPDASQALTGAFLSAAGDLELATPDSTKILVQSCTEKSAGGAYVDFYIESFENATDIYAAVDARGAGRLAHITSNRTDAIPALHVARNQSMAVAILVWPPKPLADYYRIVQSVSGPGLTGDWIIPEDRNETDHLLVLKVSDNTSSSDLATGLARDVEIFATVVNSIRVRYRVGLLGQVFSRSAILSTRKSGDPKKMTVERDVIKLLECADNILTNEQKQLLVRCSGGLTTPIHQSFVRFVDQTDKAVTLNPWERR